MFHCEIYKHHCCSLRMVPGVSLPSLRHERCMCIVLTSTTRHANWAGEDPAWLSASRNAFSGARGSRGPGVVIAVEPLGQGKTSERTLQPGAGTPPLGRNWWGRIMPSPTQGKVPEGFQGRQGACEEQCLPLQQAAWRKKRFMNGIRKSCCQDLSQCGIRLHPHRGAGWTAQDKKRTSSTACTEHPTFGQLGVRGRLWQVSGQEKLASTAEHPCEKSQWWKLW